MQQNSRFQSLSGVYTCRLCKKQTRETGYDESSFGLCKNCNDRCLEENRLHDETDMFEEEITKELNAKFGVI